MSLVRGPIFQKYGANCWFLCKVWVHKKRITNTHVEEESEQWLSPFYLEFQMAHIHPLFVTGASMVCDVKLGEDKTPLSEQEDSQDDGYVIRQQWWCIQCIQKKEEIRGIKYSSCSQPSRLARLGIYISPAMHRCSYLENDSIFFDAVDSLKILITQDDDLRYIFSRASPSLIWLRWCNCPYSGIPWWIPLEHLWVLEINSQSSLTTLWSSRVKGPMEPR